jgi:chromosomal replication initiation ATPase DnaA
VEREGQRAVVECSCHKQWMENALFARRLADSNVRGDIYDVTQYRGQQSLDDVAALQLLVAEFDAKFADKMIYMWGGNGTQKTSLAVYVAQQLIKSSHKVYYTLMESLMVALLPDFDNNDANKKQLVDKALNADLLIIDEAFDKSKFTIYKSGYQIPFLDRFLRERFDINRKAVLFVSNKQPEEISSQGFGDSLQSLVTRNVRESTLLFLDKYVDTCNTIDRKGLFL